MSAKVSCPVLRGGESGDARTLPDLEQAQAIVFGALDYAAKLGLEPHADFAKSKPHLGLRPDSLIPIEFGKDGKPYYINGPFDNPDKILAKLQKSVGKGNYDYIIGAGDF